MKGQSKQERILELFNPLIKQAIKEGKLIIDTQDGMTYLPHYFKTLIESNSILAPSETDFQYYLLTERKNNGFQITSIIVNESISNIETSKEKIEQSYKKSINKNTCMETIVKVRDLNAGKNKITTPRGMPKLNVGLRDVTISKEGMSKLGKSEEFYFKLTIFDIQDTIFEIQKKPTLCISEIEKDSSQAMFRKSKDGTKFICHRIILTDDIRDFFNIDKTKKFALSIDDSIEYENKTYFKLNLIQ